MAEVEGSVKMCNATMVQVTVSDSRQEYGVCGRKTPMALIKVF